ncbi:MAG: protein phosphatase 2C domain-containing protein [Candidatus Paceibacteria bacterium]
MDFLTYTKNTTLGGLLKHPREDNYKVSSKHPIAAVADGVTEIMERDDSGGYPVFEDCESGPYKISKLFCNKIVDILEGDYPDIDKNVLKQAYKTANKKVRKKNEELLEIDASHKDYPWRSYSATTAVAVKLEDRLIYGVLHDCGVSILNTQGELKMQTTPLRDRKDKPEPPEEIVKKKEGINNKKEFRNKIRNNPEFIRGNYAYSHGVLNGQQGALSYLQLNEIELESEDKIAVYSDGFEPYFNLDKFRELLVQADDKKKFKRQLDQLITSLLKENITVDDYSVISEYGSEKTLVLV